MPHGNGSPMYGVKFAVVTVWSRNYPACSAANRPAPPVPMMRMSVSWRSSMYQTALSKNPPETKEGETQVITPETWGIRSLSVRGDTVP